MNTNEIVSAMGKRVPLALYDRVGSRVPREELGERSGLEKVEVLEHNATGEPTDAKAQYSQRQAARKRTVRVRKLTALHATQKGAEKWVEPRQLLATWEAYDAARKAHLAWVERSQAAKSDAARTREEDSRKLTALLASVGFQTDGAFHNPDRVTVRGTPDHFANATAQVTMTYAQVATLIQRASGGRINPATDA